MRLGRAGTAVAAAAAAFGAAGLATAAIPGGDGQVDLCYDKQGAIRVIDEAATCAKQETSLAINQQGPAGADGLDGADGVAPAAVDTGSGTLFGPDGARFTDLDVRSEQRHLLLAEATVALHNPTSGGRITFCGIRQSPSSGQATMGDYLGPQIQVDLPAGGREQVTLKGHGTTAPTLAFYGLIIDCELGDGLEAEDSTIEALLTRPDSEG